MNAGNPPLTIMPMDCDSAVLQATTMLRFAGYQVLKSFDLRSAIPDLAGCNCIPESCDCQMVVLLVYAQEGSPITLVFDSDGFKTFVYQVSNPPQSASPDWSGKLIRLITATSVAEPQTTILVE